MLLSGFPTLEGLINVFVVIEPKLMYCVDPTLAFEQDPCGCGFIVNFGLVNLQGQ